MNTTTDHINPTTGRSFTKGNAARLDDIAAQHGYTSGQWATYRQWAAAGRQVRRGERGTRCLLPTVTRHDDGTESVSARPRKAFTVFAIEQTDETTPMDVR